MLPVEIHTLADGVHELTLRPSPEELGLDPAVFADVEVDLRLDVAPSGSGRRVLAQFDARATATLECARTLVEFAQPVSGAHAVLFAPPDQLPAGDDDEGIAPLPEDAHVLDLTEPIRDTLLLALPVRPIAPGAEEVEIPTTFGADTDDEGRILDPRWEALRALRDADGDADGDTERGDVTP